MDERDEIIVTSLKLVHKVCNKYRGGGAKVGLEYDDLFSIGCIGLIKAVDRFDITRGVQLSTYAVPLIDGEIRREIRDGNPGVHYSRTVKQTLAKMARDNLFDNTDADIADKLETTVEIVKAARHLSEGIARLDAQTTDDERKPITLEDQLGVPNDDTQTVVDDFVRSLNDRQRYVVKSLMNGKTQYEIGNELQLSQAQISRELFAIRTQWNLYQNGEVMNMRTAQGNMDEAKRLIVETTMSPLEIAQTTNTNINTIRMYAMKMRPKARGTSTVTVTTRTHIVDDGLLNRISELRQKFTSCVDELAEIETQVAPVINAKNEMSEMLQKLQKLVG